MEKKLILGHKKKEKDRRPEGTQKEKVSIRLARFIFRRKSWIEGIFVIGCILSLITMLFVNVNYDLTEYLQKEAASRIGLDQM